LTKDITTIQNEIITTTNTIEYNTNGSSALTLAGIGQAQQQYIFARGVIDLELQKQKYKENFKLTQEQQIKFKSSMKMGMYKQMHKDGLLTNEQLTLLLDKI